MTGNRAQSEGSAASFARVKGDRTGLVFPAHADALREDGHAFLTEAFRRFGAIAPDNAVTRIVRTAPCVSGSTGTKLFLEVEYARPESGLANELFVKFSRDFDDPLRDRDKYEMAGEIPFAFLASLSGFPIRVPKPYLADYHHDSLTGLLITETIRFGEDGIEEQHEKCMDHLLDDPLPYYRTLLQALARIAAAHKSGLLAGEVETLFPFDRQAALNADPIRWDEAGMAELVRRYAQFAADCPAIMPECARDPEFWTAFAAEAMPFLKHWGDIKRFLHADPGMIALCHWNANIDNAWFWRDAAGELRCGLMDWGRAGQLNLAFALWGCLLSAPHWLWQDHLDELVEFFVAELHGNGGPLLDAGRLRLCLDMYIATMGLALLMEAPMRILNYLPDAAEMTGPLDPRLLACERARNQLHVSALFLILWQRHGFARSLDRLVANGFAM